MFPFLGDDSAALCFGQLVFVVNNPKKMGSAVSTIGAIDLYDVEWVRATEPDGSAALDWLGFCGFVVPAKSDFSVGFDKHMKDELATQELALRRINVVKVQKAKLFGSILYLFGANDLVYKVMNAKEIETLDNYRFLSPANAAKAEHFVPKKMAPPLPARQRRQRTAKFGSETVVLEAMSVSQGVLEISSDE